MIMGMARGRPTKYKQEYIDKVDEYLAECQDEEKKVVKQASEKYEMYDNKLKVNLPTVEGYALYIGVPKRTIYEWKDKHEEFSHSLEKIVEEQRKRLINMGLSGDYQATIAKLILSSNHGMSDRGVLTTEDEEGKTQAITGVVIKAE